MNLGFLTTCCYECVVYAYWEVSERVGRKMQVRKYSGGLKQVKIVTTREIGGTHCARGIDILFYDGFLLYVIDDSTFSRTNYEIS